MGEHLKRKQADRFKHGQDIAYDRFSTADLVRSTRPEILVEELTCLATPGKTAVLEEGMPVMLFRDVDGRVNVISGMNEAVGVLDMSAVERVREALAAVGGTLPCIVGREPGLTSFFTVKVSVEDESGKLRK